MKNNDAWGYIMFSIGFFIFSIYILLSEKPFFIDTEFAKHKLTELIYDLVGPIWLGLGSILISIVLAKLAYDSMKSIKKR